LLLLSVFSFLESDDEMSFCSSDYSHTPSPIFFREAGYSPDGPKTSFAHFDLVQTEVFICDEIFIIYIFIFILFLFF
jgi:hypothetical protein